MELGFMFKKMLEKCPAIGFVLVKKTGQEKFEKKKKKKIMWYVLHNY